MLIAIAVGLGAGLPGMYGVILILTHPIAWVVLALFLSFILFAGTTYWVLGFLGKPRNPN